jgi:hypothetical protein
MTVPWYSVGIPNLRGPDGPFKPPTEAYCTRCDQWKALDAFCRNTRLRTGLQSWCRECQRKATQRWRKANPEYQDEYNARRRLGTRKRQCVDCGGSFQYRHAVALRCVECRRQRKLERRKRLRRQGNG